MQSNKLPNELMQKKCRAFPQNKIKEDFYCVKSATKSAEAKLKSISHDLRLMDAEVKLT